MAQKTWVFTFNCSTGVQGIFQTSATPQPGLTITLGPSFVLHSCQITSESTFHNLFLSGLKFSRGVLALLLLFKLDPYMMESLACHHCFLSCLRIPSDF
jgi:hypothetical protein